MMAQTSAIGKKIKVKKENYVGCALVVQIASPGNFIWDESIYFDWHPEQLRQLADEIYRLYPVQKVVNS